MDSFDAFIDTVVTIIFQSPSLLPYINYIHICKFQIKNLASILLSYVLSLFIPFKFWNMHVKPNMHVNYF